MVGPLLTTAVVATVGPQYALIVSAACVLCGTLLLLGGLAGRPEADREGARASAWARSRPPGLRTLVLASLPVGFTLGSIEVAVPAFSEAEGSKALAGVLLAVWSRRAGRRPRLGRAGDAASRCSPRTCASPGCCRWRSRRSRSPARRSRWALLAARGRAADRAPDRLAQPARRARHAAGHRHRGLHLAAHRAGRPASRSARPWRARSSRRARGRTAVLVATAVARSAPPSCSAARAHARAAAARVAR